MKDLIKTSVTDLLANYDRCLYNSLLQIALRSMQINTSPTAQTFYRYVKAKILLYESDINFSIRFLFGQNYFSPNRSFDQWNLLPMIIAYISSVFCVEW